MTLLFTESFEVLGGTELATWGKWYSRTSFAGGSGGFYTFADTVTGRYSGLGYRLGNAAAALGSAYSGIIGDLRTNQTVLFIGFGFRNNGGASDFDLLRLYDNTLAATHMNFRLNAGSFPYLVTAGVLRAVGTSVLQNGVWYWVEIGIRISDTVGWAEMRIDNVPAMSYYGSGSSRASATGDTRSGTPDHVRFIEFGSGSSRGSVAGTTQGCDFMLDDLVICNDQGTVNNDFPDDTQVFGLLPTGAGSYTQFTRAGSTPAATNWQSVDERPVNSDVDYVFSNLPSYTDTYSYPDLPGETALIRGVVLSPVARKDSSGSRGYRPYVRIPQPGGVPLEGTLGTDIILSSSYHQQPTISETKPDGTPWTTPDVSGGEFGFRITV